jgi:hypothetical protein
MDNDVERTEVVNLKFPLLGKAVERPGYWMAGVDHE